jgi:hypothetical protein
MKRIKNNRRITAKAKILKGIVEKLAIDLKELAEGKTPPQVAAAHTEYYYTCNVIEQEILLKLFKAGEDKETIEIANYFAEKQNV